MLNILEKVVIGVAIVCGIVTMIPYLAMGTPSTRPKAFLPNVREVKRAPAPGPVKPGEKAPPPKILTQSDKDIVTALKTQNPRFRGSKVTRQTYNVPVALFEEVSKSANWTKQLKTARSQVLPTSNGGTRLKVYSIAEDSYLRNFGIKDNDIIELIDGNVVDFSQDSSSALYGVFTDKLATLRDGEAISITVSRGGRPVHLEFKLPTPP